MRAVLLRDQELRLAEIPEPAPEEGEVLVRVLACGVCRLDVMARRHMTRMAPLLGGEGSPLRLDPGRDLILGHEFCGEILDFGPRTRSRFRRGQRVVSLPRLDRRGIRHVLGASHEVPGGFAERMLLSAERLLPVPDGLATEHAALTEPMAVGLHAVNRAALPRRSNAIVIGCGPLGLAVTSALQRAGHGPVVAADASAQRRAMALAMGAHRVIDPVASPEFEDWTKNPSDGTAVVFLCSDDPGGLSAILHRAPRRSQIVIAAGSLEEEVFEPLRGLARGISLRFSFGCTAEEFAATLEALSTGLIDVAPMLSGELELSDLPAALNDPDQSLPEGQILVRP